MHATGSRGRLPHTAWILAASLSLSLPAGCAAPRRACQPEVQPQCEPAATVAEPVAARPAAITPVEPKLLDNFHAIEPARAYRSAQVHPGLLAYAKQTAGIRTVINLRGENARDDWYKQEMAACEALGIKHVDIRLSTDELPSPENLAALLDAFDPSNEPLLIHCKAGADRTGMASALWRIVRLGESKERADNQLSLLYGHSRFFKPRMLETVNFFVNDRGWLEREYPAIRAERMTDGEERRSTGDDE